MIKAIVAIDENWAIGKNNDLLFKLPEDMKMFRETTKNKIVVCGRKTLESFPGNKPLKGRSTICICSEANTRDDCFCIHDIDNTIHLVKELAKSTDVFIIGGSMVYEVFLPYCDEIYVTKVRADGGGTVFFPDLDKNTNFEVIHCSPDIIDDGGYILNFYIYRNKELYNE